MRFPHVAHRSAAAHKLHRATATTSYEFDSGKGEPISRSPRKLAKRPGPPLFPADNAKAARLINDNVIGEETDVDPDGSYVSHLALYLRVMRDVGASSRQFEKFRSLVLVGIPVEVALARIGHRPTCKPLSRTRWRWPIQAQPNRF
jgi:Protein of unknown function (DUF3050)